ncbi:glutathione S-transferase C-terminal domain-containing protein [Dyella sp. C11]|uniref:glutathione S-transferase C-terminal domain-containing protein n=1 Tax=Dyella sp. C11 TaxID=2126991 RepID=UPI0018E56739|nr:glutathione S-transferase C-terminal domain-containing protein [Dyella sp. C11]
MTLPILYAYPDLFGVADNNPFGLKVYAFMRLCDMSFEHRHILDTKQAPRGQLPYLVDGDESIGDSDAIIAYLKQHYGLPIDTGLTRAQQSLDFLLRRTLDDLYWPMSYSRWKDDRYWPLFCNALLATHGELTEGDLAAAREYNALRYHYQGIGRYEPAQVYERGIADLRVVSDALGKRDFLFGDAPRSIDAAIYGFVANIYFYDIDTPLKQFVLSRPHLVRHCEAIHAKVSSSRAFDAA